jgi:methionyl-tRNA formyltransferase
VRVIFAGTPEFARVALERLHTSGHTIALVLSQPDRPAGRGLKLQASAVKQFAIEHAIPVIQPRSLRLDGKFPQDAATARQAMADAHADVMVVAAYGLILPQWVLDDMALDNKFGCLNIHGSLLPRWRGAAPIHRAIEAGDPETGVTIMQMDAGLDTGNMLLMHSLPIVPNDTTASLHDRMADLGGKLIVMALDLAAAGHLKPVAQPTDGVTYAHKIEKHEAALDWRQDAATIVRRVHAFNPFPGATATLNGEVLKIWEARVGQDGPAPPLAQSPEPRRPGTIARVAADGIVVQTGDGCVVLTALQRPGGKRLSAVDFVRGFDLQVAMCFDLPER